MSRTLYLSSSLQSSNLPSKKDTFDDFDDC